VYTSQGIGVFLPGKVATHATVTPWDQRALTVTREQGSAFVGRASGAARATAASLGSSASPKKAANPATCARRKDIFATDKRDAAFALLSPKDLLAKNAHRMLGSIIQRLDVFLAIAILEVIL